jgi:hypothetical protein
MSEPILMPFQSLPFNGDIFICNEFINLKEKFKIITAIETGSCVYSTTKWLGLNFKEVFTVEVNEDFAVWGRDKIEGMPHVGAFIQDSVEFLKALPPKENAIFFLDAHWGDFCPLLSELEVIAKYKNPVIAIHDFKVPNEPNLGYDSINGQAFEFEWIKPSLEAIYGVDGYDYYYNSNEKSTEIKRGIIYITPKTSIL